MERIEFTSSVGGAADVVKSTSNTHIIAVSLFKFNDSRC